MGRRLREMRTMKRLFEAAEREAQRDGAAEPGAEHLLVAACELDEGSGRRALAAVGCTVDDLRTAITAQRTAALAGVGVVADADRLRAEQPAPSPGRGPFRSSPSLQAAFQRVSAQVRAERAELGGARFLLDALDLEHGTLARTIDHLGVDRADLHAAAVAERG